MQGFKTKNVEACAVGLQMRGQLPRASCAAPGLLELDAPPLALLTFTLVPNFDRCDALTGDVCSSGFDFHIAVLPYTPG